MTSLDRSVAAPSLRAPRGRLRQPPLAAQVLLRLLQRAEREAVEIVTPDGQRHAFGASDQRSRRPMMRMHDWRIAADVLKRGDVGFAEAYLDGRWESPDLVATLTFFARNREPLGRAFHAAGIARAWLRLRHWLNANTRTQASRNIAAHYDIGNAFYRVWLDETMSYSSACFEGDPGRSLEQAQGAKYRRVLEALALPAGAHVLEVGCGWGGFAEVAARAGHRVTGLSLSQAQTAYARERMRSAGLAERVDLRVQDYRDERGTYDGLASIEMIEAVGERWWPAYFARIAAALPRGRRACLQAITIDERLFDDYRSGSDFIQQYIFPGGMLPTPARIEREARRAGLQLVESTRFGADYAETLRHWLAKFDARVDDVRAQGFDERFVRCWRFYLAYCIAGFAAGSTDVGHYTFVRA